MTVVIIIRPQNMGNITFVDNFPLFPPINIGVCILYNETKAKKLQETVMMI